MISSKIICPTYLPTHVIFSVVEAQNICIVLWVFSTLVVVVVLLETYLLIKVSYSSYNLHLLNNDPTHNIKLENHSRSSSY